MTTTRTAKTSHKEQLLRQSMELIYARGTFVIALSSGDGRSLKSVMDTVHECIAPR